MDYFNGHKVAHGCQSESLRSTTKQTKTVKSQSSAQWNLGLRLYLVTTKQ